MQHEHAVLIDELGGGAWIAREIWGEPSGKEDRRVEAVYKWKKNGVPWRWRPFVARLARRKRKQLPAGFLPGHDGRPSASNGSRSTQPVA